MGAPNTPEKPTDAAHPLAVSKQDLAALTDTQRAEIAQRKNANIVTAQLSGTNWGKGVDEATRRAVADWGARNGIDVTTEIYILGGSIYLNAQFYENRLVGLMHRGHILDYRREFIHADARLEAIANEKIPADLPPALREIAEQDQLDAFRELRRRRRLRIEHGAPEVSPLGPNGPLAIGLTTIVLAALPNSPIHGVKWAPHDAQDPVGKNYPQETALTRSARRALKQCVTHIPELARWVDGSEEDAVHTVAVALREHEQRKVAAEKTAALTAGSEPGQKPVATADYLTERPHREDATQLRGPVAVQPAPAEPPSDYRHPSDAAWVAGNPPAPPMHHEHADDLEDTRRTASLEDQLGPRGAGGPESDDVDEMDDTALMDPDERREWERRRAAGRK